MPNNMSRNTGTGSGFRARGEGEEMDPRQVRNQPNPRAVFDRSQADYAQRQRDARMSGASGASANTGINNAGYGRYGRGQYGDFYGPYSGNSLDPMAPRPEPAGFYQPTPLDRRATPQRDALAELVDMLARVLAMQDPRQGGPR